MVSNKEQIYSFYTKLPKSHTFAALTSIRSNSMTSCDAMIVLLQNVRKLFVNRIWILIALCQ